MRKTNHVPWMGRTVVVAIMAFVGLGLFAGSAAAQTVVYDYDDHGAWWDSFDCPAMKRLLPALTSGNRGLTADETTAAHEERVCAMTAGLEAEDVIIIRDFITATMHEAHATHKAWWNAQSPASNACTYWQQALAGQAPIGTDTGVLVATLTAANSATTTPAALTTGMTGDYCGSYDRLNAAGHARADMSGNALSGRAMMTDGEDDEEDMADAPALPLVGIGLLGLLLAGRGAWLRRRA